MCAPLRTSDLLPETGRRSAHAMDAAITVSASIVYPVDDDAGKHNKDASPEHRRNFEVDFLVNGAKFAEAEHPPYQASYTRIQLGQRIPAAWVKKASARTPYDFTFD